MGGWVGWLSGWVAGWLGEWVGGLVGGWLVALLVCFAFPCSALLCFALPRFALCFACRFRSFLLLPYFVAVLLCLLKIVCLSICLLVGSLVRSFVYFCLCIHGLTRTRPTQAPAMDGVDTDVAPLCNTRTCRIMLMHQRHSLGFTRAPHMRPLAHAHGKKLVDRIFSLYAQDINWLSSYRVGIMHP